MIDSPRPDNLQLNEILKRVPHSHAEFVFPARGSEGRTFSGFSKTKVRLDALIVAQMPESTEDDAEPEPWRGMAPVAPTAPPEPAKERCCQAPAARAPSS